MSEDKFDMKNSLTTNYVFNIVLQIVFTYTLFYLVKQYLDIFNPNN